MGILLKIMGSVSILLLICTLSCGLWIRFYPQENMQFHFVLSFAAVVVSLLTIVLFMFKK